MTAAFDRLSNWHTAANSLIEEHEHIVEAIERGDGNRAGELVHEHITTFYNDQLRD